MQTRTLNLTKSNQIIEVTEDSEYLASYIANKDSSIVSCLEIVHNKPNLKSRIVIKAIVFDSAKFDLEAVLKINRGAYNTDTYLKIDCLVVGNNSYARAIPSLEIHESEVKGGHGATIGYIDENQLNYLYSKGISKALAEDMLIEAFLKI